MRWHQLLYAVLCLWCAPRAMGQAPGKAWHFVPSVGFGTCFEVARVEQADLPESDVRLGTGLLLNAGIRVRPPGRSGLELRGEYGVQGYAMRPGGERFNQYSNTPRVELQPTFFPRWLDQQAVQLALGVALGISYPARIGPSNSPDAYTVRNAVAPDPRPYLALDLAAGAQDDRSPTIEVALRYLAHLDRGPAWTSTATSDAGQASFSASDNYYGMMLRLYFRGKGREVR